MIFRKWPMRWRIVVLVIAGALLANRALASDFIQIDDASQIKWQIDTQNNVYLRNLHTFDASYLGCCYNYWIDASTDKGKSFLTVLLARAAAGQKINIGIPDKALPSEINYIGAW